MFHDPLIPPDELKKYHETYGQLADAVDKALALFLWVLEQFRQRAYEDAKDIHLAPIMMLTEFAEPIDGVSVLVRSGSAKNCIQLLRSALEIQLGLEYLLETKETYEQRCLSSEYFHLQDKLRWAEKCDPESPVGKQLRIETTGHVLADIFDTGLDVKQLIQDARKPTESKRYEAIRSELARMKAAKHKPDNWFGLWDGPRSVRELAYKLKQGPIYEILYRSWSSVSHGQAALKRVAGKKNEGIEMNPIRSPLGLPGACRNACQLTNRLTLFVVEKLIPESRPEMRQRYIEEVRPGMEFINSVKGLD